MKIDVIVAEIGSTTTVVSAFNNLNTNPIFIGQGFSNTTVLEGDVNIGLYNAIDNLKKNLNVKEIEIKEILASSSAAGGLKMSVHGLVYDMTVKAAKEAALGAGANIKNITAGILSKFDLEKIKKSDLNIIMIAGGVDYGEKATALENSYNIASLKLNIPVIYAGNIVNHDEVKEIFRCFDQENYLYISNNVYPKIDSLNVDEARLIIQKVFEEHITKAKGMEKVKEIVNGTIIPTPGAVMESTILLSEELKNIVTVDIGGATTDIHSVTEDSSEMSKYVITPEPINKRTVEGDLGIFVNKDNVINLIGIDNLVKNLGLSKNQLYDLINNYQPIPNSNQLPLTEELAKMCLNTAIKRHAGEVTDIYTYHGKSKIVQGKDLTDVNYIIGTGGALTRLPNRVNIIQSMLDTIDNKSLKPRPTTKILIDNDYIMAAIGVLSKKYKDAAKILLNRSLGINDYVSKNRN